MIVKEITHTMRWNKERKIQNLIAYIFNESKMPEGGIIKRNISGYDQKGWATQLIKNDQKRKFNHINRSVMRHTVLSFSPESEKYLTMETLRDIGKQYAKKRSESLMVGAIHQESGKPVHLHLMISAVTIHGESTRISRGQFRELKVEMEQYIQDHYPDIHRTSFIDHHLDRDKPP